MKAIFCAALLVLVAAMPAFAKDYEVSKKAGEYEVTITIDKNPPVVGDNMVTVEVKEPAGNKVTDAKVSVAYSMPAMPGMPAMKYSADAEPKGDKYTAKMRLSMSGSWNIAVKITRGGKSETVKFTVDAH